MVKIIIAGGRDFNNYNLLKRTCTCIIGALNPRKDNIEVVCGKARGADTLGEQFAQEQGYKIKSFPTDWETLGKKAGYVRNAQMASYSEVLIAFWDRASKGTKHMIDLANKQRLKVFIINY
jgi:hypothetical protein